MTVPLLGLQFHGDSSFNSGHSTAVKDESDANLSERHALCVLA
jgi:hypothetical protein